MRRIRFLVSLVVLGVLVAYFPPSARGWEFNMGVSFNWADEWNSQTGNQGFFGPYNIDNGVGTRAANLNFWNGARYDTNITTSKDAGWSYFNVEVLPEIKINPAIRIRGKYRLGTFGDPNAPDYHTQDAPGINNAFSEGQWTMFWVTAQTPWGIFGIGKRPWTFGTGLQYDGEDSETTESLTLVVPYGPLDIGIGFYPYRFAGNSSIPQFAEQDPYNLPGYATTGGNIQRGQYFSRADKGGTFSSDVLAFLTYANGPLNAGILASYGSYHIGSEALLINPANPPVSPLVPLDSDLCHGTAYVKYNSGRFFLNAEGAWLYWTDRFQADPNGVIGPPNPRYIEQWRYMVELGVMAGPAKLSLLNAWTPGPDRRNGILIGKQPAAFVRHPNYDNQLGNYDVFRPYSYLFSFVYGAGLNAFNLSRDGYIRDAFVLAGRLDYAVASNLNLFGTFCYANRTSNGYSWGCIGPNAGVGAFATTPNGNVDFNFNRYPASPNIPDTALGYEIDTGFDWKLLEGFTAGMVFAYWQPGKWFSYACVDRSVSGWQTGVSGNLFGTRPGRTIDPIIGGKFALTFSF